jgi:predicted HTH domain antitoxin
MNIILEDTLLAKANISTEEVKCQIGLLLYQKGNLSVAKIIRLLELNRAAFLQFLADKEIYTYTEAELAQDLTTIKKLDNLL